MPDPLRALVVKISGIAAARFGLPPMVGYLLCGFVLNFSGVVDHDRLTVIGDLGVTLLLFTIGLKLDLRSLLRPVIWAGTTVHTTIVVAVLALAVLFDALWDSDAGVLDWRGRARSRVGTVLGTAGMLGIVMASYWHGDALGHWVSKDYVVERLGKTENGQHCVVHMPRETPPEDARRLLDD